MCQVGVCWLDWSLSSSVASKDSAELMSESRWQGLWECLRVRCQHIYISVWTVICHRIPFWEYALPISGSFFGGLHNRFISYFVCSCLPIQWRVIPIVMWSRQAVNFNLTRVRTLCRDVTSYCRARTESGPTWLLNFGQVLWGIGEEAYSSYKNGVFSQMIVFFKGLKIFLDL